MLSLRARRIHLHAGGVRLLSHHKYVPISYIIEGYMIFMDSDSLDSRL